MVQLNYFFEVDIFAVRRSVNLIVGGRLCIRRCGGIGLLAERVKVEFASPGVEYALLVGRRPEKVGERVPKPNDCGAQHFNRATEDGENHHNSDEQKNG